MKKKIFSLLALFMAAMTASAFSLTKATGAEAHGTVVFKVNGTEVTTADEGQTVTVVITPSDGWVVNEPAGQWYAAGAARIPRRSPADPGLLGAFELTKLLGQDNTWSFVMERANAEISVSYKKLLNSADITIESIPVQTYTGQAIEPVLTVKDGSSVLVKGTDYDVVYMDNVKACPADAGDKAPTAIITACETSEKYAGGNSKTFTIEAKELTNDMITPIPTQSYTGEKLFPEVEVVYNGMTLEKGTDYSLVYSSNKNVGTATVTVSCLGNYSGVVTVTFAIDKALLTITADNKTIALGEPVPEFTVTYYELVAGETPDVLGGGLTFQCDYDPSTSGLGTYVIEPGGLTSNNYDIIFTPGTLTVTSSELTLDEEDDNTEALGDADGRQRDVTLKRTLQAGGWNTLALPFALSANQIAAVFGSGAKVKAFTGSSLSGSTLTLDFADAQAIEAGKPYLVKVSEDVDLGTQSIEGVTVSAEAVTVESASVDFIPTLGSTTITGSTTKSVLFLAAGNNLLNPTSLPADIKGFRAYFQLKGAAAAARAFSLNLGDGEPLSISPVGERTDAFTLNGNGIRYTLDGRKVNGQPKNGVYIQNGRKVVK